MFSKKKFYRRGIPTFIAFIFLWFVGDPIILPYVFEITDSGNINLLIWILVDAIIIFFTMFFLTRQVLFRKELLKSFKINNCHIFIWRLHLTKILYRNYR